MAAASRRRQEQDQPLHDPAVTKPDFEVVPWRFSYRYRCGRPGCGSHAQTIVDWEVVALWRHVRQRPNWQDLMRQKLEREMWQGKAAALFVGNQIPGQGRLVYVLDASLVQRLGQHVHEHRNARPCQSIHEPAPREPWLATDRIEAQRIAVLCVEREAHRCHREVITDMAVERNPAIEVVKIL